MEHEVLSAQFDAGLDGLGLLRSWPSPDPVELRARLEELRRDADGVESRTLEILDVDEGYVGWSATYDTRVNQLLLAEQPRRCVEPTYTPEIVSSFLREGTSPAIRHLEGLPFALVWDLELPAVGERRAERSVAP
jgi:hypothetical protein